MSRPRTRFVPPVLRYLVRRATGIRYAAATGVAPVAAAVSPWQLRQSPL